MTEHGETVPLEDVLDEPVAVTVTPEEIAATDPFGNSKRFEVDKEINLAQLQHEIEEASGATLHMAFHPAPGGESGTLYVSPGDAIDGRAVVGKIKSHHPDPLFGLSDDQRLHAEVMQKIRDKQILTPEELTIALQALAERR